MIYFLILLDILINNYTIFTSFFFITYLYNKPYKYYLITGLILDIIIFKCYYNLVIITIMYLLNKLFNSLNKKNICIYIYINLFNYFIYILLSNIIVLNNIKHILFIIGYNLLINLIFYYLSYNYYNKKYSWDIDNYMVTYSYF